MKKIFGILLSLLLVVTFGVTAVFGAPTLPPSGMIAWWTGDNTANDLLGSYNGILLGDTTYAAGKVANAFSFDGTGDAVYFGDVLDDVFAGSDKQFTIDLWLNANSLPSGAAGKFVCSSIIGKIGDTVVGPANERQFALVLRPAGCVDFVYYGSLNLSPHNYRIIRSAAILNTNEWYHLAVTYDGSVDTGNGLDRAKIYINGILDSSTLYAWNSTLGDIPDGLAKLTLGAIMASNGDSGYYLNGLIDEVEIFNRVLSASEVSNINTAGTDGKFKSSMTIDIKPGGRT